MLRSSKRGISKQINTALLLFHTIKYLRWPQIWFRVYYHIRKVRAAIIPLLKTRTWKAPWASPQRIEPQSIITLNKVVFLNEPGELITPEDWNCTKKNKLWLYNLHYFDALNGIHSSNQSALLNAFIDKWIKENPPFYGNGWEPYPLSIRIVNWIKWFSRATLSPSVKTCEILGLQAHALMQQLEYHIGGNHLFINGKALVFLGAFFEGEQANRWLRKGLTILDKEMNEQFLNDGAHYELSPMYHALMMWDICDLIHLADCTYIPELLSRKQTWERLLSKALVWLQCMCHPDGEIAFFNDATLGVAPKLDEIQNYCNYLHLDFHAPNAGTHTLTWLKESGYGVVNLANQGKAFLDIGKIGPTYQPGHAHADSLSFELSLYGERVFVNSGISQYGNDATRLSQRGTKAHNTVNINHENSSEVWSGFRVARRANPRYLSMKETSESIKVSCTHDGYRRLPGRNLHEREWEFLPTKLTIRDKITGFFPSAEARFYFHPHILIQTLDPEHIQATLAGGKQVMINVKNAEVLHLESSTWHPNFGTSQANNCLVVTFKNAELLTTIEW